MVAGQRIRNGAHARGNHRDHLFLSATKPVRKTLTAVDAEYGKSVPPTERRCTLRALHEGS